MMDWSYSCGSGQKLIDVAVTAVGGIPENSYNTVTNYSYGS